MIFFKQFKCFSNHVSHLKHQSGSIIKTFQDRGLVYQYTSKELSQLNFVASQKQKLNTKKISSYCGYDPSSDSLHLGNLITIISLARLSLHKIDPIFLVGGATGLIGDPSGKSKQRNLLQQQKINKNIIGITNDLKNIYGNIIKHLDKKKTEYKIEYINPNFQIVNNRDHYQNLNVIQFMRQIGKYFRMNVLISKQNISKRLDSQQGISYTQFSYTLLQSYDFLKLYQSKNCILQIGGSDQWGNITNGCDIIKKSLKKQGFGLTLPLLLTNSGQKFGKTQGNALYLNKEKTPMSDIYQYLFNTPDDKVSDYLKIFSFIPIEQINQIVIEHNKYPQKRLGQKKLCEEVLNFLGDEFSNSLKQGQKNSFFFKAKADQLKSKTPIQLEQVFSKMEQKQLHRLPKEKLEQLKNFIELIYELKFKNTKAQIKREIEKGGVYINNQQINFQTATLDLKNLMKSSLLAEKYLVIRFGKKNYKFVQIIKS